MAKKENRTIDENFMKEIISQGLPIKQRKLSQKKIENNKLYPQKQL